MINKAKNIVEKRKTNQLHLPNERNKKNSNRITSMSHKCALSDYAPFGPTAQELKTLSKSHPGNKINS